MSTQEANAQPFSASWRHLIRRKPPVALKYTRDSVPTDFNYFLFKWRGVGSPATLRSVLPIILCFNTAVCRGSTLLLWLRVEPTYNAAVNTVQCTNSGWVRSAKSLWWPRRIQDRGVLEFTSQAVFIVSKVHDTLSSGVLSEAYGFPLLPPPPNTNVQNLSSSYLILSHTDPVVMLPSKAPLYQDWSCSGKFASSFAKGGRALSLSQTTLL